MKELLVLSIFFRQVLWYVPSPLLFYMPSAGIFLFCSMCLLRVLFYVSSAGIFLCVFRRYCSTCMCLLCVLFYVSSVCVRCSRCLLCVCCSTCLLCVCVCACVRVCVCVCVILQAGLNNFVIGKKCDNEKRSDVA